MINFDYNLLKILAVLLETQSTTVTADKLATSQPAISRSLKKTERVIS
ncbi:LysR family transcriptional regulator [Vibrio sp. B1FLJ16]|nr:LysR family transcriptional regulator [Vibrio sp. B1FLJ16]